MTFIQGSLTDANPGPALHALMAPALTTAGFTLVDTVTISTRTHKVWKSAAANNTQGLDWYLDIGYTTTGAGTIALTAFEMFDPATDLAYRGPYCASSTILETTYYSRFGATGQALETSWTPNASTAVVQVSLTTAAFGYWCSITADRAILLGSGTPSATMYAGFYTPDPIYAAKAGGLLYPLFTGKVNGIGTSSSAALTRVPPAVAVGNWASTADTSYGNGFPQLPGFPTATYPFVATPIAVVSGSGSALGRWGWLQDVYAVCSNGAVRGDTCTIGGVSCVLNSAAATFAYAFKAV